MLTAAALRLTIATDQLEVGLALRATLMSIIVQRGLE